jgi:aspartate carbamoyltransferase catalytic subunit
MINLIERLITKKASERKNKNLISIDDLTLEEIKKIHKQAEIFFQKNRNHKNIYHNLRKQTLINLFFESSTRTRASFEIAAKNLGAKVVNIDINTSSIKKGESIADTAATLNAMNPDFVVIRHSSSGIFSLFKKYFSCVLINAGDGINEHPTQALLDSFVIWRNKRNFIGLKIAICGDVLHSRVAHSNIKLLKKLGCKIFVITPSTLITKNYKEWMKENFDVEVCEDLINGIKDADVIMMLRIQRERMSGGYISSLEEYFLTFGLTQEKLKFAKSDVIIMHPGPINRDVEISFDLADNKKFSLILEQVESGIAVRQSLLKFLNDQ